MRSTIDRIIITCEHAGNHVPPEYAGWFQSPRARQALASHRGYDPGSARAARGIAALLAAPLLRWTTTRLLVEVNRSVGHPRLFSEFSRRAASDERDELLARYYTPHRERVTAAVETAAGVTGRVARPGHRTGGRRVLHVGVHSFVPRLGAEVRNADVGLLYDPARSAERALCLRWQRALESEAEPGSDGRGGRLRVRRNYPYRGDADGLTTTLRRRFGPSHYLGIELEINQARLVGGDARDVLRLVRALVRSLRVAIAG